MRYTIDVTCGIYNTQYSIIRHRDGSVTVKAPYIDWRDNTGCLMFMRCLVTGKKAELVKKLFAMDELYDYDSGETMDSLLWG